MDKSKLAKHIKLAMKITEMLRECETTKESLTVLSNVTMNFFLTATKSGCTLRAFREYCNDLREKLIAAEEAGIKTMLDGVQEISEEQVKSALDDLKKSVESIFKEDDFNFRDN